MVALVDCNSFYASCEQLFRPDLANKPVVVLSNNDGVIVARSKEVKKLGFEAYQDPYFKLKDSLEKHKVSVFSSNYTLYGDISGRVMSMLSSYSPEVEVYSIDEMFLSLKNMPYDLHQYALKIRNEVTQGIGVPVSIGVSYNKTLSKVANKIAKKREDGVYVLKDNIEEALKDVPVADIWGVGRRYASMLRSFNINTAYELIQQDNTWIRKKMTVVGLRMVLELRGEACIDFEEKKQKQQIIVSRSFSRKLTHLEELQEAVASYASKAAEKTRAQKNCVSILHVFLSTPVHNEENFYSNSIGYRFDVPTSDTARIVGIAKRLVCAIFVPGKRYMRLGVLFSGLVAENEVQLDLFSPDEDNQKKRDLLKLVDKLKLTHNIQWGSENPDREWQMNRKLLSPRYTTNWNELPRARIE